MTDAAWLAHPGGAGPFRALMDGSARPAAPFCRLVESRDPAGFAAERPCDDPAGRSQRAVALHVVHAMHVHALYVRRSRGMDTAFEWPAIEARFRTQADLRPLLRE